MVKILCLGDIGIDRYSDGRNFLGGCSYNNYFHLSKLGAQVDIMSPLGNDKWSGIISQRVVGTYLKRDDPNLILDISIKENGEKIFGAYEDTLLKKFSWTQKELDRISDYDLILSPYFEEIRDFLSPVVARFGERLILDLHEQININQKKLSGLVGKVKGIHIGRKYYDDSYYMKLSTQCDFISLTLGEAGSELFFKSQKYQVSPKVLPVVDSTGAGDAYLSRFIKGYISAETPIETLNAACSYAGEVLQFVGATEGSELE